MGALDFSIQGVTTVIVVSLSDSSGSTTGLLLEYKEGEGGSGSSSGILVLEGRRRFLWRILTSPSPSSLRTLKTKGLPLCNCKGVITFKLHI